MKYIIKLEDGRFVKRSLLGKGIRPQFSLNQLEAEEWGDPEAAVAWCEETGEAATVIPIETVVESLPAKPRARKVEVKKPEDM